MVVGFESGLIEMRLGLQRAAQNGGGLAQALGVILRSTAAQGQQGQGALLGAHHVALAAHQGVDLEAQFGEGGVLQPAFSGLDQGRGQGGTIHLARLSGITQAGPGAGLHGIVQAQVVGQGRFFGPVVAGGPAGQ